MTTAELDALPEVEEQNGRQKKIFWSSSKVWVIPCAALVIFPFALIGVFGLSVSQLSFGEMNLPVKALAILICSGFLGPLASTIFILVAVVRCPVERLRLILTLLLIPCLICSALPCKVISDRVLRFYAERQYCKFDRAVRDCDRNRAEAISAKIEGCHIEYCNPASKNLCRGVAFEMSDHLEDALRKYWAVGLGPLGYDHKSKKNGAWSSCGRILYKMGKYSEAFDAYCQFADVALARIDAPDGASKKPACLQMAKRRVLFFADALQDPQLTAFENYDAFLTFIEREYERTETPERYERAVQFWRDAAAADENVEFPPPPPSLIMWPGPGRLHQFCLNDSDYFLCAP